jgi:hypothetical protein
MLLSVAEKVLNDYRWDSPREANVKITSFPWLCQVRAALPPFMAALPLLRAALLLIWRQCLDPWRHL